ncbi:WD40 repeat-like protein [Mycena sanguinolenta]|uniref:WD40 repeat-like protein n=1 Tax=Mycena sanguinolenta TaxID=230812 RepID=A0A8H6ZBX0_9AGAR|nr:WD40 repeat-like protein [Mycena sanguinolenta]
MTGKEQTNPSNFWDKFRGKLKQNTNTMEEPADASRGADGPIYIGAVYGGTGGLGGPGTYGGSGGMGQGPHFSGPVHVNKMYGASRQAYTMLSPWFAPKALFNADAVVGASARRACTANTRVDLISCLKQWAKSIKSSPIFWLSGMAGTGKSTVAYTLWSRLSIVPTIAQQLSSFSKPFAKFMEGIALDVIIPASGYHVEELLIRPWRSAAVSQPKAQLRKTKPVMVVIDALDEIENDQGSEFVKQLIQAVSGSKGFRGLRFLITSRPHPQIINECSSINEKAVYRIENIDPKQASEDIRCFLNAELTDLSPQQLEEITLDSGGLFIYASTIVRYLCPPNLVLSPNQKIKRLDMLKPTSSPAARSDHSYDFLIDSLYNGILTEALKHIGQEIEIAKRVLYCVVTTHQPLKISDLAALVADATEKPDSIAVHNSLQLFYAVLYISPRDQCIYTFHKSFADFILDPNRSPELANLARSYFADRTRDCLAIMNTSLQFNICNLTSSFLLDEDDKGLPERVATNIGSVLRYACQYWAAHLISVHDSQDVQQLSGALLEFCHLKVLFWMEAMNLLKLNCRLPIHLARIWALQVPNSELNLYMGASQRLWASFVESQATRSTPHLYISSLTTELALTSVWANSALIRWQEHFPRLPSVRCRGIIHQQKLMTLMHTNEVWAAAMAPTGTYIASGSDKIVQIWDATTGNELMKMGGHTDWVRAVVFSPNGAQIVSGSSDKTVRIWDATTGNELIKMEGHTDSVWSVAFSPNGAQIVSGSSDKTVRIWDVTTGNELMKIEGHTDSVRCVAFSPNGAQIVSGSSDKTVRIWDATAEIEVIKIEEHMVSGSSDKTVWIWDVIAENEVMKIEGHTDWVLSVAFSPDGAQIVSASYDKTVRIWDATTGTELMKMEGHTDSVWSVAFSPNGAQIVSGSYDKTVRIWDTTTGNEVRKIEGHTSLVRSVSFSPNGAQIVSGSSDKTVWIWDATTGSEVIRMEEHTDSIRSVAFSPNGAQIVSGSSDKTVRIWDVTTRNELRKIEGHTDWVRSVAFSPNGAQIVSGSSDKTVRIWDATTGMELIKIDSHTGCVWSVAFSPNGAQIISGSSDKTVRLWDATTGNELMKIEEHTGWVLSVAFSPNGTQIVSGSSDNSMQIWDTTTGNKLMKIKGHTGLVWSVAFSPNGAQIVSGSSDKTVWIWDATTGTEQMKMEGHTDSVWSVAFSPNGAQIVSGSYDKTVWIWDATTGNEVMKIEGHTDSVLSVAFSLNGAQIVSGSSDNTVQIWDATAGNKATTMGPWLFQEDGWVVLSQHPHVHLFWYPSKLHHTLHTTPCLHIISTKPRTYLKLDPDALGPKWAFIFSQ